MTKLERVIKKWWDDEIDVNDLVGSLKKSLAAGDFQIVSAVKSARKPFLFRDEDH